MESEEDNSKPQFGPKKKPGLWDEYLNKYIAVNTANGNSIAGKLVEIKECYGFLKPYNAMDYTGKKPRRILNNKGRALIPLIGASIEPTTRKNLEGFFKHKSEEKQKKNTSKELSNLKS